MFEIIDFHNVHLEELRKIYLDGRKSLPGITKAGTLKDIDFDNDTKGELVLVAMVGDAVAGFVSVWTPDSFIHHLYVAERFRGNHIGPGLINAVFDRLGCPIVLKCLVSNKRAIRFYEQNHFRKIDEGVSGDGPYFLMKLDR